MGRNKELDSRLRRVAEETGLRITGMTFIFICHSCGACTRSSKSGGRNPEKPKEDWIPD